MFVTVTLTAFLLAPDWAAVGRGLTPSLPPEGAGWIIGLIGAIGGTMALISYGYWIREEGRTGEEGLPACRFELVLSYAVIGLFGLAVVIIGSRTSVRGQGNRSPCCSQISSRQSRTERQMDLPDWILGRGVLGAAWRVAESSLPVHRFPAAAEGL